MRFRHVLSAAPLLTLAGGLAACSDQSPTPAATGNANGAATSGSGSADSAPASALATSTPVKGAGDERGDAAQVKAFPPSLLGSWGLVPGDCTSQQGDTKGLAVITAKEIRFYESVARIARLAEAGPAVIRGTFNYDGEGIKWSREMALNAAADGRTLILQEYGADAVPGPRTYTRCP